MVFQVIRNMGDVGNTRTMSDASKDYRMTRAPKPIAIGNDPSVSGIVSYTVKQVLSQCQTFFPLIKEGIHSSLKSNEQLSFMTYISNMRKED